MSRDDGVIVGRMDEEGTHQVAPPGGATTYRWYAGHLEYQAAEGGKGKNKTWDVTIKETPIEFGAVNLLSADRIKQPQKGLFGALVIEPKDAALAPLESVPDGQGSGGTRKTRALRIR